MAKRKWCMARRWLVSLLFQKGFPWGFLMYTIWEKGKGGLPSLAMSLIIHGFKLIFFASNASCNPCWINKSLIFAFHNLKISPPQTYRFTFFQNIAPVKKLMLWYQLMEIWLLKSSGFQFTWTFDSTKTPNKLNTVQYYQNVKRKTMQTTQHKYLWGSPKRLHPMLENSSL